MVDVSEWAQRETERVFGGGAHFTAHGYRLGLERMAALLLSDEAVEAAADQMWRNGGVVNGAELRLALQAAVSAVTTTNPNTPISETGEQ